MAVNSVRNSTSTIESVGGIGQIITSFGSIAKNISGGQPQNQSQEKSKLSPWGAMGPHMGPWELNMGPWGLN